MSKCPMNHLTTSNGAPIGDLLHSQSAGANGPLLLQDFALIDSLAHFDRERIPERVVHAKGAGAFGDFVVTNDVSKYTKANFLAEVGKTTPVLVRFSTVGGEKGSADTARDPRGFAVKFYTEEGNYDMVGNNTPVFFINDPRNFPVFIHTQKRNPQTNLGDPNAMWDFFSQVTHTVHQVTILFSDRGIPDGYRHMNGYSSHTFSWLNEAGDRHWIKYHFKTDQGIKNLTGEAAGKIQGSDLDYATRDLFDAIAAGNFPSWSVKVQIMPDADAAKYRINPFDITRVWPHSDYPLIDVGKMTLNRNAENYFAEIEQAAFSPSHLVPGIEVSPDKLLQGRLFSYPDTQRHRLGTNYQQIPVNCPYRARVNNQQRDGHMAVANNNGGKALIYTPATQEGSTVADSKYLEKGSGVSGCTGRFAVEQRECSDFEQAGALYQIFSEEQKARLVAALAGALSGVTNDSILERSFLLFDNANAEYGSRVREAVAALKA